MTDYIYNEGTSAHRGVWHVVEGEIIYSDWAERSHKYKSDYFNETTITKFPAVEKAEAKAKVMCASFNTYSGEKGYVRVRLAEWEGRGGPSKPKKEHTIITKVATLNRKDTLVFEDPPFVPAPLCTRCKKKAGV
jgi:hypothetical protein